MKKLKFFLPLIIFFSLLLTINITYAAVVAFYRDDSRLQLESAFDYSISTSDPGITYTEDINFSFPSGSNPRTYTITFLVDANEDQDIYFAVYHKDTSSGISSFSGGARGMVPMGTTPTSKQITVNINNTSAQSSTIGLIYITLAEYNGSETTIYDSINDVTYVLI